jgi:two-component system phosphate regulon sensor histidine kinase PhoR
VRAETSSKDEEINRLSAQINDMAGELSATIEDLRQEKDRLKRFLVDASHELRTPVTALSAYLEMLSGKAGEDAERRREYIDICIAQNNRSRDIVIQLLELLRMEQIGDSVSYDRLDAANLFEDSIAMMYPAAQEKRISLQFDTSRQLSDVVVYGNRYQLLTALKNIVENAIKYSPEGSTIVCELSVSEDRVEFIVSDTGMGIQEEELSRVFDRFYRSKKACGKGSGLGLSIVKRIIENHDGIVTIANRKDVQGVRCIISLPKAPSHQE